MLHGRPPGQRLTSRELRRPVLRIVYGPPVDHPSADGRSGNVSVHPVQPWFQQPLSSVRRSQRKGLVREPKRRREVVRSSLF